MKKLILYDHQGEKQLELDVYLEGQDFAWEASEVRAYWLGTILIVDQEPANLFDRAGEADIREGLDRQYETSLVTEEEKRTKSEFKDWEDLKEEATSELTQADNQDTGDRRLDKTEQYESLEDLPQDRARRLSTKGSNYYRKQ